MDVREVTQCRANLEEDLAQTISAKLATFRALTGLSIESVDVSLVNVTSKDDIMSDFLVNTVHLGIQI
jgi:hypothetical protein